jgi:glycosyltransferase involved in cell wall biosynthesis
VITVSNSTAASLRDVGLRGQIHVVENPLLAAFDVETKPQIGHVAFIGRLTPSKRIDDIIRAVALAANTNQCIKLTIIGAGSSAMIKELRELTKRLGVAGKVRFVGRVSDEERDSILETVDVLALASVREGWGLVVSEAARWRIPTVGYKVAGLVDSVVHGQTGLLVEEQTPAALSEGLLHLIGDRQMRDRFGAAAAARLTDFSAEHFHDKLITALNSVPLQ